MLSKLNAFLDSELEQVICFNGNIDAELFASERSAIFLILPEEDATKNFVASLMIQNLARELFAVANEHGGKLQNRAVFFCDELGTMPPFDILPLFSAGRSRRLTLVPIIQSLAQLVKNYGSEGAEIIQDNCQDTIFGGFAPNSQTAETLSKNLGSRTVLSGQITRGKDNTSQSLQNYYIPVEGKLVEVEEPVYTEYYRMSRRERYLEERDKEIGVLSYDALDNNGLVGQEMFQDRERGTLEDMAMARELLEQLHRCIGMLPKAEQELIHAIYFEGMRDTEYARKVRMSQSGVSRKHKKTLSKLRFLMNFIGSF